jgi:class 3 adenylate cyclase
MVHQQSLRKDHRHTDGAPVSVATFLSTDIEGSTRRWEAAPDAMRIALETHNETLRKAVEVHAGHVFKYTGDGMCAVFDSPRSAVDAAVAGIQEGAQDVPGRPLFPSETM